MHVRMMQQVLTPGVEDGEEANLGAQMFGVPRDGEECLGGRAEENAVDYAFVVIGDGGELFRHREDHVVIVDRQQFGLAVFEPAGAFGVLTLRTVPVAARVISDAGVGAVAALFDMAAERRRAADLDGAHDTQLIARECAGPAIGRTVSSKNAGQLDSRPRHDAGYFFFDLPSGS